MKSEGHSLVLNPTSEFNESDRGSGSLTEQKVTYRMRLVAQMFMAGEPPEVIAEKLGYAGAYSIYQVLRNPKIVALIQQTMDYYDESFRMLYPEVIAAVKEGLRSIDEKVQLTAAQIWLKSHGKMDSKAEQKTPTMTIEQVIANILIQGGGNDSRSLSDRELIQDTKQRKTNRRFYIEPESEEVRRAENE